MRILACDPGISGAFALLVDGHYDRCWDMPTAQVGKTRVRNHVVPALVRQIMFEAGPDVVVIENVHAMPTDGAVQAWGFGRSTGVVEGVAAGMLIAVRLVTPQQWKKAYGLIGQPKDAAREVASRLFPAAPLMFKKNVGRADAILLAAHFGGLNQGVNDVRTADEPAGVIPLRAVGGLG